MNLYVDVSDVELRIAEREARAQHRHCWHSASAVAAGNHDARCCECRVQSTPTTRWRWPVRVCFNLSDGSEEQFARIAQICTGADDLAEVPPGDPLVGRRLPGGAVVTACPTPDLHRVPSVSPGLREQQLG